jgi:hypothetical protein
MLEIMFTGWMEKYTYQIWSMNMKTYPIGSMYGIYANIWGILMANVTIYSIHGSYGYEKWVPDPVKHCGS